MRKRRDASQDPRCLPTEEEEEPHVEEEEKQESCGDGAVRCADEVDEDKVNESETEEKEENKEKEEKKEAEENEETEENDKNKETEENEETEENDKNKENEEDKENEEHENLWVETTMEPTTTSTNFNPVFAIISEIFVSFFF